MTLVPHDRQVLVDYRIPIVGFAGNSECGKDHMAKLVHKYYGLLPIGNADHPKIDGMAKGLWTFVEAYITKPEPVRRAMQVEMTEKGRDVFGQDVYINVLLDGWMPKWVRDWNAPGFAIYDMRFPNEIEAVQAIGGFVILLKAPQRYAQSKIAKQYAQEAATHRSESLLHQMPDSVFGATVSNDFGEEQEAENAVLELVRQYTYERRGYHPSQRANAIRSGMKL